MKPKTEHLYLGGAASIKESMSLFLFHTLSSFRQIMLPVFLVFLLKRLEKGEIVRNMIGGRNYKYIYISQMLKHLK